MNARDRVYAVLNNETPDRVPVLFRAMNQDLQYQYIENYAHNPEDEIYFWRDVTPLLAMKLDAYDISMSPKKRSIILEDGKKVDTWGRIRQRGAYIEGYFKNGRNFSRSQYKSI